MNTKQQLTEVLGVNLAGAIAGAFACMDIAEEEIAVARLAKEQGSRVFSAACPPDGMSARPMLYRAHVREIIAAVRAGEEPPTVTDAGVLQAIAEMSLAAPLRRPWQHAYEVLFHRAFGDEAERHIGPRYEGRDRIELDRDAAEIIEQVRRKLAGATL